jgi:hypothetical protein
VARGPKPERPAFQAVFGIAVLVLQSLLRSLGENHMLMGALITFLVVILILYLINMLPLDSRAKQICRIVVIILGVISLAKYIM